ncbi:MAG: threonine/serine dehydratase [Myxococcota bacterium]
MNRDEIQRAMQRIDRYVRRTPITELERGDARIVLKLESMQRSGSFKARGAFNSLLAKPVSGRGVITASGGNHGAAVAYAAHKLGVRSEIFVPTITSPVKLARLREYAAAVTVIGNSYAEAHEASLIRAKETKARYIHAYDQPEVIAGQGTVAMELEIQAADLDTLLVSVGGGGLLAGCLSWYEQSVRIIAVEPSRAPTLAKAMEAGQPVDVEVSGIAADSLGARRVGELMFPLAQQFLDRVVLVEDSDIAMAQALLWSSMRLVVEPGGAAALAALTAGRYRPSAGEKVGVVVCGGNADLSKLAQLAGSPG